MSNNDVPLLVAWKSHRDLFEMLLHTCRVQAFATLSQDDSFGVREQPALHLPIDNLNRVKNPRFAWLNERRRCVRLVRKLGAQHP